MALEEHGKALASSLEKAGLVPGSAESLIPKDFKPTIELGVDFGGRGVELGNLFRVSEVKTAPSITFQPEVSSRISMRSVSSCTQANLELFGQWIS